MNDNPEVWPPAPSSRGNSDPAQERPTCPTCKRKLLTQASILCNWCGAKIDDADYLERAARQRQERDEQERARVEAVAEQEARYGVFGRLKRLSKAKDGPGKPVI